MKLGHVNLNIENGPKASYIAWSHFCFEYCKNKVWKQTSFVILFYLQHALIALNP
jgi:hypothetical protein